MLKLLLVAGLLMSDLAGPAWAQTSLYVSPGGSDKNAGNERKPLASLAAAQALARKIPGPVTIILRGGTHYLAAPVVFGPQDARQASSAITIKALPGEKAVVSGAAPLRLRWKKYRNGIMQARVSKDLVFDQLFVDGQLQRMARYPNYDSTARFLGGTSADAISAQRAANWANPVGAYVHALHRHEWGGFNYIITGKNQKGEPVLEGGWQNNRRMGLHRDHRFVENVFEELDAPHEWYYHKASRTLYYYPPQGLDLARARIESPQLRHLFEFRGSEQAPVRYIHLEGLALTHTLRTFMDNKEPLLRSDWTTYRGGAVFYEGAEHCRLVNCFIRQVGGNAVYYSKYNRGHEVAGCRIYQAGGSGVSFVGDPQAVRSPSFEYNEFVPFAQIDRTPGPKTNNYPARCLVYNNLIEETGETEIQSAGVQISMAQDITLRHNTISNLPRAGINISEGTWGGHIIEYNDVFNTVRESGDHGSFNSWGRDRYWHPKKAVLDTIVEKHAHLVQLDVVKPIIIRHNRFRCDHGWDVDLDDGSSNYHIYNNLLLNGGLKLREGYNRRVENNIMVNNTFHPHVWFKNSQDVFRNNILFRAYAPILMKYSPWGKQVDANIFLDEEGLEKARALGQDQHSVYAPASFINPGAGDYRLQPGSPAFALGFRNFDMDKFGVVSPELKAVAQKVVLPVPQIVASDGTEPVIDFMGLKVKNLSTPGERSATGMASETGVLVLEVRAGSRLKAYLQPNDVILEFNRQPVNRLSQLLQAIPPPHVKGAVPVKVFRNQREQQFDVVID